MEVHAADFRGDRNVFAHLRSRVLVIPALTILYEHGFEMVAELGRLGTVQSDGLLVLGLNATVLTTGELLLDGRRSLSSLCGLQA